MQKATENQIAVQKKLSDLNVSNPLQAIINFIKVRPVNSKSQGLIKRDLQAFQFLVSKIQEKDIDILLKKLNEQGCSIMLDYLHRYMQFVGESNDNNITSGSMLKIYDKILKIYGPSLLLSSISKQQTLTTRIKNFT